MAAQRQEIGHVTGYVAKIYFEDEPRRVEVDSVEAMREILRRQGTPGDELHQMGMEFSTLIQTPTGFEEDEGFGESAPPGTIMYRLPCICGEAHMWCLRPGTYLCERCLESREYGRDQQR